MRKSISTMRKSIILLSIISLFAILNTSCGNDPEIEPADIKGVWHTSERSILFDNKDYQTLYGNSINQMFKVDAEKYDITRTFNVASSQTVATDRKTGQRTRLKEGKYRIEGDTLYLDDSYQNVVDTKSTFILSRDLLLTSRKLDVNDIKSIMTEIGSLSTERIPADAKATLKMKEIR